MNSLNTVPSSGTYGESVNRINANFGLVETAINSLEYNTSKYCGYFQSASALSSEVPSPKVGMWAVVSVDGVDKRYVCNRAGTWTNTGETYSIGSQVSFDVVNNLTSSSTDKPLSAYMGTTLQDTKAPLANIGYYECATASATAAKVVSATGYMLEVGGWVKIKFANKNTNANPTLNINSTGAKPLYYAGELSSSTNTWDAGETVVVYYDGTNYYANSASGLTPSQKELLYGLEDDIRGGGSGDPYEVEPDENEYNASNVTTRWRLVWYTPKDGDELSISLLDGYECYVGLVSSPNASSFIKSYTSSYVTEGYNLTFEDENLNGMIKVLIKKTDGTSFTPSDINTNVSYTYTSYAVSGVLNRLDALENKIPDLEEKKEISILFIGNSLTQDAVSYLPLVLSDIAPDVRYKLYIWYNGGKTLSQQYNDYFLPDNPCEIYSECVNATSWTNSSNSVRMSTILANKEFDIVCLQEYFNYKSEYSTSDKQTLSDIIDYLRTNYEHQFEVVTLFHQPLRSSADSVFELTKSSISWMLENSIVTSVIPSGAAIYYAMQTSLDSLGDRGHLSPDGTHAQEGLPCLMQAWVTALWVLNKLSVPTSINNSDFRVTSANYSSINVPGPNLGTGVVVGTESQDRLAMDVAIKAYKLGLIMDMQWQNEIEELNSDYNSFKNKVIDDLYEVETIEGETYYSSSFVESVCSLGSTKWYRNGSSGLQRHIVIPVLPNDIFDITPSRQGYMAWLTRAYSPPYSNNNSIPFVSSETSRITVSETQRFVAPPESAYLCLTTVDGGDSNCDWTVVKQERGNIIPKVGDVNAPIKLCVSHWNIGHFALGESYDTSITHANYAEMRAKWAAKINHINADIMMCCEYNTNMVNASGSDAAITAREAIFPKSLYDNAYIGTKPSSTSYMQTAIFSNLPLSDVKQVVFPNTTQEGRYYQVGDMVIGNTTIKVVETHLDWNQGSTGEANRALQIQKLIGDFADYDYVIIGADFNVGSSSEYDAFVSAGYYMANHGYLGDIATYPAGQSPSSYLDNILSKGFTINNINIINDEDLSDHCCVYANFTLIR